MHEGMGEWVNMLKNMCYSNRTMSERKKTSDIHIFYKW